jgi:REase_AHJR-like
MSERDLFESIAEQYRKEGYTVHLEPSPGQLPDFLKDEGIDLVAEKGTEHIAIQVKRREQLYDVKPIKDKVSAQPGWSYEIIVYPQETLGDSPRNGKRQDPRFTGTLIEEAENLLKGGAQRAAFIIAWSAVEAAMRQIALRQRIAAENVTPGFIVKSLYSAGIVSREDFDKLTEYLSVRNEVIHGFEPANLPADAPRYLLDFAQRLLSGP